MRRLALAMLAALTPLPGLAGQADVVAAEARRQGDGWTFSVTVRHADAG